MVAWVVWPAHVSFDGLLRLIFVARGSSLFDVVGLSRARALRHIVLFGRLQGDGRTRCCRQSVTANLFAGATRHLASGLTVFTTLTQTVNPAAARWGRGATQPGDDDAGRREFIGRMSRACAKRPDGMQGAVCCTTRTASFWLSGQSPAEVGASLVGVLDFLCVATLCRLPKA